MREGQRRSTKRLFSLRKLAENQVFRSERHLERCDGGREEYR